MGVNRRKALGGILTAVGAGSIFPKMSAAQNPIVAYEDSSHIYSLTNNSSGRLTTFNPITKQKAPDVKPGQKVVLAEYNYPGIITHLWMTCAGWFWEHWDTSKEKYPDQTVLKKLILRIYYDGNSFPSVEAPIGDFFGNGFCEYKHYVSKYIGMSSGGFYCYFPMPFNKIKIEVENLHDKRECAVFLNADFIKLNKLPLNSGRFHCMYNMGTNAGSVPFPILKTKGKGKFIGCSISMQSFLPNYLGFLEAPEYIYIDQDEKREASIIGTGLEDYFNGGWYFRDGEFYAPLHGVPIKDSLKSMVSMYRFHELDAISFKKSFEMEFINPRSANATQEFKFSSTAYWYQEYTSPLIFNLPPKDKLVDWYRLRDTDHQSIP